MHWVKLNKLTELLARLLAKNHSIKHTVFIKRLLSSLSVTLETTVAVLSQLKLMQL
jgi:hypothetical protein